MKDKQILFLDTVGDAALNRVVQRALVSTGCKLDILNRCEDAASRLSRSRPDMILVNYDTEAEDLKTFVRDLFNRPEESPAVLVSQRKDKVHLIELFSHSRLRNLVARNGLVSEAELIITTEKLMRQDIFGLDKYLTWGVNLIREEVKDSAEKTGHVARVGDFVRSLKCDDRFVRLAEIVTDELLMNALYDAPVDASGKPVYAHLPRTERVQLGEPDRAWLEYGSDGQYFAIACRDRFGALKAQTVVDYLRKCFAQDEYQIDTKAGGAGVGFYMIFQSLSQLVVNIDPGKVTETLGLIDIRTSYRDTKARSKSFNIFIKRS